MDSLRARYRNEIRCIGVYRDVLQLDKDKEEFMRQNINRDSLLYLVGIVVDYRIDARDVQNYNELNVEYVLLDRTTGHEFKLDIATVKCLAQV